MALKLVIWSWHNFVSVKMYAWINTGKMPVFEYSLFSLQGILFGIGTWVHYYQPIIDFRNLINKSRGSGFVYMSASCSVVEIGNNWIIRSLTCSRKWWYEILMCFVRGVILGDFASSSAPRLSSNALQNTVGAVLTVSIFLDFNSSNKLIIGITSLNACDKVIYLASVVLRLH